MDKQKSYGENYQQVRLKHKTSLRFWVTVGVVCLIVATCIVIVGVVA